MTEAGSFWKPMLLAGLLSPGWAQVAKRSEQAESPLQSPRRVTTFKGSSTGGQGFRLIGLGSLPGAVPTGLAEDLQVAEPSESHPVLAPQGWDLVRPDGTLVARWSTFPGWPDLERRLRDAGWRPQSENLLDFIALHPEAASARLAYLLASMREGGGQDWVSPNLIVHFPAAPPATVPPSQLDRIEPQLLALLRDEMLPDNPLSASSLLSVIRWLDPWLSTSVRSSGQESVGRWLLRWPSSAPVWETLAALCPGDRFSNFANHIQVAEPLPGEPWPPAHLAAVSVRWSETRCANWSAVEALALWAIESLAAYPAPGPRAEEARRSSEAWQAARIRALWALGRGPEALQQCASLKFGWPTTMYFTLKKLAAEIDPDGTRPFESIWLKAQSGYRDEPGASRVPLRLHIVGDLSTQPRFKAFEEATVPFTGGFLRCEFQPGTDTHWSMWDGEGLVEEGQRWPEAEEILRILEKRRPGTPFGLGLYLRRHPDCLEARQRRATMLAPNVSKPVIGYLVLEDTLRLHLRPSELAGQIPPARLEHHARPALANVEAALFLWPDRQQLWEAWVDWMVILRRKPVPHLLADTLPWPPRHRDALEAGPVPFAVAHKVLELLIEKRFNKEADTWAEWIWREGLSSSAAKMVEPGWEPKESLRFPGMGVDRKTLLERLESRFLTPWRKSLAALGRKPLPDLPAPGIESLPLSRSF